MLLHCKVFDIGCCSDVVLGEEKYKKSIQEWQIVLSGAKRERATVCNSQIINCDGNWTSFIHCNVVEEHDT